MQKKGGLSSLVFPFGLGSSLLLPGGGEACSEEATVQKLTAILYVCLCVCVCECMCLCVFCKMKGHDGLGWTLIRVKMIIPAE